MKLPVILDDVLLLASRNTTNLARLLRDFAARGHQLLLITSHEKHAEVFARLDVPIADLADRQTVACAESEGVEHAVHGSQNGNAKIPQQIHSYD